MLTTLIKALDTTDLVKVVSHMALAPIDIDLILYKAQDDGEIEIDKKKSKIKLLKEPEDLYYNPDLVPKLVDIIQRYDMQGANITRARLEEVTLALNGKYGYLIHDFVCSMYALEQGKAYLYPKVNKYEISVPAIKKKRPYNKFVFYTFADHQEFGAKAANDFIDQWDKINVK